MCDGAAVLEWVFAAGLICTCGGILSSSSWKMTWGWWFWLGHETIFSCARYGSMISLSFVISNCCWWRIWCGVWAVVSCFLSIIFTLFCMLLLVIVALSFSSSQFGRFDAIQLKMLASSISFLLSFCLMCDGASCFHWFLWCCHDGIVLCICQHCYVIEVDHVCHSCTPCLFYPHLETPIMLAQCSNVVAIGCIAVPCFSGVWFYLY